VSDDTNDSDVIYHGARDGVKGRGGGGPGSKNHTGQAQGLDNKTRAMALLKQQWGPRVGVRVSSYWSPRYQKSSGRIFFITCITQTINTLATGGERKKQEAGGGLLSPGRWRERGSPSDDSVGN